MKTILKNIKEELLQGLPSFYKVDIIPPNIIVDLAIPSDQLPFISISPLSSARSTGQIAGSASKGSTGRVNQSNIIQIGIRDVWADGDVSVVGDEKRRGIIGYVEDVIGVLEFNTLSGYLPAGVLGFDSIEYSITPGKPTNMVVLMTVLTSFKHFGFGGIV